jgi:mono/diheme cytochrome c family protein
MLARIFAATVMVAIVTAFSAHAQDLGGSDDVRAGRELAITTCSECHVVVPRRWTPRHVGGPPDFVDIAATPGMTATALFVFLYTPHPTMPDLVLSDGDSNDAIAYILSLKKRKNP